MTDAGKMGTRQEAAADIAFRLRKTSQRALDELAANLIEAMSADLVKATIKVERLTAELEAARAAESPAPTDAAAQKESFVRGEMGMAAADRAQTTLKRPRPEVAALTDAAAMREAAAKVADAPQNRLSRDRDIILEAINEYDEWMKDDDYEPFIKLREIIERMRGRVNLANPIPDTRDGEIAELRAELEKTEVDLRGERTLTAVSQKQYKRAKAENATLRSNVATATEALEPFAYFGKFMHPESEDYDEHRSFSSVNLKCGMFVRARSALSALRALPLPPDHRESGPKTYGDTPNDSINAQAAELAALRILSQCAAHYAKPELFSAAFGRDPQQFIDRAIANATEIARAALASPEAGEEAVRAEREACARLFDEQKAIALKQLEDNIAYSRRQGAGDDLYSKPNILCRNQARWNERAAAAIRARTKDEANG